MSELDRRLDRKLRTMANRRYTSEDYAIADAKDADMGFGLTAAGPVDEAPEEVLRLGRHQTWERYLDSMRAQADHGASSILLTSAPLARAELRTRRLLGEDLELKDPVLRPE